MRGAGLAGVMAMGLVMTACGDTGASGPSSAPAERVIGAAAKGTTIEVALGEPFMVELESIPTAGYVWRIKDKPAFLILEEESTRPTNPEFQNQPGVTGGNHWLGFTFRAAEAGEGALRLVEGRPWELDAGAKPEDEFTVTIRAR